MVDNDRDEIDEGVQGQWYADADADGFGDPDVLEEACEPPPGTVPNASDCDDGEPNAYPATSRSATASTTTVMVRPTRG